MDKFAKITIRSFHAFWEHANGCDVFCPLFSEAFNASRFCFDETNYAYRKNKVIVPIYLEKMEQESLDEFYQFLGGRQDLRLYQYVNAAQFSECLEREQAFTPCKPPEWNKVGLIQWHLSADGVLMIAQNEDLPLSYAFCNIPHYQEDPIHKCSTAPWAPYREKILSVEIADDIDAIGDCSFIGCERLTDVYIGDDVTNIGNCAFHGCTNLKSVRIPNSVTKIGNRAFAWCYNLTDVRIPDSVTEIGNGAFDDCRSLTNVRIPDGVTEIGNFTFACCNSLTNIRIPDSVTIILDCAFVFCENLTDVYIPDSVTEIRSEAFQDCPRLDSVEIPIGAKIADDVFPKHTRVIRRDAAQ